MFAFFHNILIKLFFGSVASSISAVVSFVSIINKASAPTPKASTRAQSTRRVRRSSSISSSSSSTISSPPTPIETDSDFAPSSSSSSSSGVSTPASIASPLPPTINIAEAVNKILNSSSSALVKYQPTHTRTRQLQTKYQVHQVGLGLSSPFVSSSFDSRFSA